MADAEYCDTVVMATVLKKVPHSITLSYYEGSLRPMLDSAQNSLGKALCRGLSIPDSNLHCRDRGDVGKCVIVRQGISSLPVAREHKATQSPQTIGFNTNVLIQILQKKACGL